METIKEIEMEIDDVPENSDSEYEEEEFLVYVDIEPTSLGENQIKQAEKIKFFGLETKKPLLQINNLYFEGESDISMGTHLFFEKDVTAPVDELYCKCESYYKFQAKTNKILKMSRVLIKDNAADTKMVQEKNMTGIKEQLKVTRSYEEALNLFLVGGRNPPRESFPQEENFCENLLSPLGMKHEIEEATSSLELQMHGTNDDLETT